MERALVAAMLLGIAILVALVLDRRRRPAPPTQPRVGTVPSQLDRDDFDGRDRPWLVALFTSATCESCERVLPKARVLECESVGVVEVPYPARKDLHDRYGIDVVPTLVVANAEGVVRASFVGVPTATDLWAAVAEARNPGSSPEPDLGT